MPPPPPVPLLAVPYAPAGVPGTLLRRAANTPLSVAVAAALARSGSSRGGEVPAVAAGGAAAATGGGFSLGLWGAPKPAAPAAALAKASLDDDMLGLFAVQ